MGFRSRLDRYRQDLIVILPDPMNLDFLVAFQTQE